MTIARIARIKSAQDQLIAYCGGIDDTVELLDGKFGRSTVGRWKDLGDGTLMPLAAVMALESACGQPVITGALAELAGRRLSEPDAATVSQAGVLAHHADAIINAGELMRAGAAAFADGRVSPNEATTIDRAAANLQDALVEYRKSLAGVRAQGGLSVVEGGR